MVPIMTTTLLKLAELNSATNAYKPVRPSQILKSEENVSRLMNALKEEYVTIDQGGEQTINRDAETS